jgi:abortive infection bacteriophage resistance protein
MLFDKPPTTADEQLALLISRGLIVTDSTRCLFYLRVIGYYRLSAYFLPFQIGDQTLNHHQFQPKVTFDDILALYVFDRKLRLCLLDGIERTEIAIRARIVDTLCSMTNDSHWHLKSENFGKRFDNKYSKPFDHPAFLKKIAEEDEVFFRHYRKKYSDPADPPSWMAFQVLSFGTCSFALAHLKKRQAVAVCNEFGLEPVPMLSWIHELSVLRNHCAHHACIWNRFFVHRLSLQGRQSLTLIAQLNNANQNTLEGYSIILDYFVRQCSPGSLWRQRLLQLCNEYYNSARHPFLQGMLQKHLGEFVRNQILLR